MQLQSRLFGSEIDKYGRRVRKPSRKNLRKSGHHTSFRRCLEPDIGKSSSVISSASVNGADTATTVDETTCGLPTRATDACFVATSVVTPSACTHKSSSVPKGTANPDAATGSTSQQLRRRPWYPSVKEWVASMPRIWKNDSSLEQQPHVAPDERHLRPPVHAMTILLGATTSQSPPHAYQRHLQVSPARLSQACDCCLCPLSPYLTTTMCSKPIAS